MSLAWPWMLALLPLPLLLRRLLPPLAVPRPALRLPAHLWRSAEPAGAARGQGPWLAALAWSALVLALAGPRIEVPGDVIPASGRDIVLVMDLSGSMLKEDFFLDGRPVTRLDAVKHTASAFVAARRGDRIGLVIFGERAYFAAPLTFDVDAVARAITEAQIGISGRGTAISDGLGLAAKRLSRSDAPTRVIVLMSDGVDTSGTVPAVEAARLAHDHGIRVHSIALGPEDLENQPRSRDAVDLSPSVAQGAGLDQAKLAAAGLAQALSGRPIGLVLYGGEAFTASAPTLDIGSLQTQVGVLDAETMPGKGSRPAAAIGMATQMLAGLPRADLVLISDGGGVDRQALAEADRLEAQGVRISALRLDGRAPGAPATPGDALDRLVRGGAAMGWDDMDALAARLARSGGSTRDPVLRALQYRDLGPWLALLVLPPLLVMLRRQE